MTATCVSSHQSSSASNLPVVTLPSVQRTLPFLMRIMGLGQVWITTQFFLKGRRESTLTGYLRHCRSYTEPVQSSAHVVGFNEDGDGVDMSNKVVVITGANSGIGFELATYAAGKKASVYMFCRSDSRGEAAREKIVKLTGASPGNVKVVQCDVSSLSSVVGAVEEFKKNEGRLDCLVCNAGVLLNERTETADGHETTLATHLLFGSYALGKLLLPTIDAGSGRVIFVSSGGMYNTKFPSWPVAASTDPGSSYSGNMAYGKRRDEYKKLQCVDPFVA